MSVKTKVFDINKNDKMKTQFKKRGLMYHVLYLFFVNTALRVSDIIKIQKKHIHGNRLIIQETKTKKGQNIELNSGIMEVLPEYLSTLKSDDSYLFPSRQKNENKKENKKNEKMPHITRQRVAQIIKECAKEIGIEDTTGIACHSLRKMRARVDYEASGHDIGLIMTKLNHSSARVTLTYMGYTQDDLDALSRKSVL